MKVKIVLASVAGIALLSLAGARATEPTQDKAATQEVCPMSGRPIDPNFHVDHEGQRVYFCSPGCVAAFEKDPAKYMQKLEAQGIQLEHATRPQTHCPIMGGEIDRSAFTDYQGKRIYFCCQMCDVKFLKDPEEHIRKMESAGIELEAVPVPQTMCPVMDMEIDRQYFVDYEGQRIYFCCEPCIRKFNRDPETYVGKLQATPRR